MNDGKSFGKIDTICDLCSLTDWTPLPAFQIATMIVARASNRVIVGVPLCRNNEYLQRCIMYTKDLIDSGHAVNRYPWYLKSCIRFINPPYAIAHTLI
jgi:hypothetical protein